MDAFLRRVERIRREEQVARVLAINAPRPPPFQPVRSWRRRDKLKTKAEQLFKPKETNPLQTAIVCMAPCFGCGKPSRSAVCVKCKHLLTKTLLARAAARRVSA